MKCVILCAGYATRLYPLTLNIPKALLPIGNKPLLNYIIEKINSIEDIDEIFIVSNDCFYFNFIDWKNSLNSEKNIKIINGGTKSNEDRLGGVGDLWFVIEKENIGEDFLLILGDNFFDLDLKEILDFYEKIGKDLIGFYDIGNLNEAKIFGVMKISPENNKILSFEEKPVQPKSTLISTGIYVYSKDTINKIKNYMKTDNSKEGPGHLIPYLLEHQDLYGFPLEGNWYDIGSKDVYEEVNKLFGK